MMEKPKIRFESFEKKWESYRLSEYSSYRRGSFPQPYGNKEWYGGNNAMPFVQVVDVLENLRLVADTKQKISTLAQPMSVFVPSNSVIVTLQGSIGRVAITQYDAYVDRTILIFEDYISQTNKEFWAYTIRNKFEIERQKAPGGTIKTITKEALSDFKVSIPSYSEQSAIGSLFRILDDLLASYKDNLANYQSLKTTMLSKMFPKAGQTVPEIRLDGFEDEWEEKKLGEIVDIIGGGTPDTNVKEYWNGEINWFSPTEVGNSIYLDTSEKRISELGLQKSSAKILPANRTILFTSRAGIGSVGIITKDSTTNQGFQSLVTKQGIDIYFLFSYSSEITRYALKHSAGSTFLEISGKELGKMDIIIPTYEEQQAIGSYFSNLDQLITSYQDKITQLETLKKKLLQDMFI